MRIFPATTGRWACTATIALWLAACGGDNGPPQAPLSSAGPKLQVLAAGGGAAPAATMATQPVKEPTGNGLIAYAAEPRFPQSSNRATNYWVDVVFATGTPQGPKATLWSPDTQPLGRSVRPDSRAVNVGLRFVADVPGYVTGVRFYKGPDAAGTAVASLWTLDGQPLASASFAPGAATGWQQVDFDPPVPIAAGTAYVASTFAPQGGVVADRGFFSKAGVSNPPLHAPQDGVVPEPPPPSPAIVPLHDAATVLEPDTVVDTGSAIVTRFGDRARDRHAREAQFRAYDHYLSWYWEQRTATVEIIDRVAKGGNEVVINVFPLKELSQPEFRAFFRGITTQGEYSTNVSMTRVGTLPYHYTTTLTVNTNANRRPIQIGDRMEIEVSQFLRNPDHGRANYYGTAVLYVVGQGGVMPWEGRGPQLDSFPLPATAWLGGRTTLPYPYSNEPDKRFMQTAGHLAPASAQAFMLGRRLHHTDFSTGAHTELPDQNPVFTEQQGRLGPAFYASSCVACHRNNGRAIPPGLNTPIVNAVTKVGTVDGGPDPQLGHSLQPLRTDGPGEGAITISGYALVDGQYADGTPYQLRRPLYSFLGRTPSHHSLRNTPALVGMGLLEAVPESAVAALADPDDADGDGISGRLQTVVDPQTGQTRLGRFGWKAVQARLSHQVASALNADMGILSSVFPQPDCGSAQTGCGPSGVELPDADLARMVRYVSVLGVPARRDLADAQALQGEALFASAGCVACHVPTWTTGPYHPLAELRNQTIRPYTDLLLHDMGPGLADNLPEAQASGAEWRTPPLWGLGLTAGVAGGAEAYLHDGRARNLSEAILWHGGEGEASQQAFRDLNGAERAALLKFLKSL